MIRTTIEWNEDSIEKELPEDESGFWKGVAEVLPTIAVPNTLYVNSEYGNAEFYIGKRGTFAGKDGKKLPSMYVTETYNNVRGLSSSTYPDAYLTCINPGSNNYKYYWLRPEPYGIGATYGRIGSDRGDAFGTKDLQNPYPTYMYWIRYYEKLSKGYIDQTDIYLNSKKVDAPKKTVKKKDIEPGHEASAALYKQLMAYAKHVVQTALTNINVTEAQVKESKKRLNQMGQRKTVKGFNNQLMRLLSVCPRKVRHINELLAYSTNDFPDIIAREEALVAAMEALVTNDTAVTLAQEDTFAPLGIEVYYANNKQKNQVLSHLNDSLKPMVKNIYRVIPTAQQKRFNSYLKKEGIEKVIQLWHGSKNENWFSIIQNGLLLNPNAQITGKMFGNGIYFAPSAAKSWNYTSYNGTYWANGRSDTGFMGLYAVAYGKPLDVQAPQRYTQSLVKNSGANCVHAHAGNYLRNDEIIFYHEDAMVLNYIVEFA